jgi:4-amino-4-deoxy-L-arabinose transferase-like glycosyltransferase
MQRHTRYASWLGLAFLTLCALGLRLFLLDKQSLWYDEGVTAEVAQRGLADLTRWTAGDIQPPLYYYVVALWGRLAGWSEWSLRFPSVFFGVVLVPLLASVAIALTRRRLAGIVAATLAAFHPLLLYYSQEARMYAMLTALGVLLGYLVIHGETVIRRRGLHWLAYVFIATAAIYTHYFAFFLLLALALAYLVDQLFVLPRVKARAALTDDDADLPYAVRREPLLGFVVANSVVLLLYLPWIAALANRLSMDASYWQGQFKVWEALRHAAISLTSGETVLEAEATQLLWAYAGLTLISVIALLVRRSIQPRTILYALLWLALPIAAVMLLASAVPKFNARYVMIALPGLLVLWSAGLTALIRLRGWGLAGIVGTPFRRLPSLIALALLALLLAGFAYSSLNWFRNPAFTKAEWRELSRYVRERIAAAGGPADELIVLVSGHAWPVWHYYAPDLPPLRLPDLEILNVNAVLDVSTSAAPLAAALAGKSSVWLVQWQADVVDPMNVAPLQLQLAGAEEELDVEFWQLRLHHYVDVRASDILTAPIEAASEIVNFGNQIELVTGQVAANGDLLLFWRLHPDHAGTIPDLAITGETFTAEGLPFHRLRDERPVGYAYPVFRWRPEQINLGHVAAADWAGAGALPGVYRIRLGVYDAAGDLTGLDVIGPAGQPLGKFAALDVELPVATRGPDEMDPNAFAQIITDLFLELQLSAEQAEPGQAFAVELHWYAEERPPADYDLLLRWRTRANDALMGEQVVRLTPLLPTGRWPDDELLRQIIQLRPPLNLPADDYWLEVGLTAPESRFVRVPFRVLGSSRIYQPPPYRTVVDVVFGEMLHLLGIIEPLQLSPRAGEQVALTLVWQALDRMPADYTVTVQWLGPDARPAAQSDLSLPGGSSNWVVGQVELQTIFVSAPKDPGVYRLVAAVYDANQDTLPRVLTHDGRDLIDLGDITVTSP